MRHCLTVKNVQIVQNKTAIQRILRMGLRYARPRTRRQGESPVGDWHRRFHGRLRGVASTAVKSPSPPFGFRPAAGHEKRPSPHTKTPASRASRTKAWDGLFCRKWASRTKAWDGLFCRKWASRTKARDGLFCRKWGSRVKGAGAQLAHCSTAALGYAAKLTSSPSLQPVRRR